VLIMLVYRLLTLKELVALVEQLDDITDDDRELLEIIALCGSFLTFRQETILLVHQLAKDNLLNKTAQEVFPYGKERIHHTIFARSLTTMSRTLQQDLYRFKLLAYPIEEVEQLDSDPLAVLRYSCVQRVDHLCDSTSLLSMIYAENLQDGGALDVFLRRRSLY
jgi:hypothetical protein